MMTLAALLLFYWWIDRTKFTERVFQETPTTRRVMHSVGI